jgi:translation elongation factor EF-Ts
MSIEIIKKLREETGLSFAVIKEAVNKYEDIDAMRAYLHALRIEDTHDQVAKKGRVVVSVKEDIGLLFEVNAMTDFVSSHPAFNTFINTLEEVLLKHPMTPFDDVFLLPFEDSTVSDARIKLETLIGEHVKITRVSYVMKTKNQVFGIYQHHNFRSASLVVLEKLSSNSMQNESAAKVIATHVASMGALTPKWKQTIIDQILKSTLYHQEIMVHAYLIEHHFDFVFASRFELGETMEEHLSCSLLKKEACSS